MGSRKQDEILWAHLTRDVFQINEKFIKDLINYRPGVATQFLCNILTIMATTIVRLTDDVSRLKSSR